MATIRDTSLIILFIIFSFTAIFYVIGANANSAGIPMDSKYNDSYNHLQADQQRLDSLSSDIKSLIGGVDEAKSGEFGFFGLRGVLGLLRAPVVIVDIAQSTFLSVIGLNEFIPDYIRTLINLGIAMIVVFAIIAFITQRGREP